MTIENFMMLLCGLGLFLYGMKLMGDGLELAAGSRLKTMIERLTTNKYMGALIGLAVTAVIQSSSATTVMVVGFVNAGLMSLAQAVGVIMGANIGTTVTGFMIAIKLNSLAPIAIFLGVVMMMFCKKNNHKHVGQIICGFGILFYGMTVMSTAMEPLSESEFVHPNEEPLPGLADWPCVHSADSEFFCFCWRFASAGGIGSDWFGLCDFRHLWPEHRNLCDGNDGMCRDDQDGKTYGDGTLVVQCARRNYVYDYHIGNTVYGSCKKHLSGQCDDADFDCSYFL